MIEAFAGAYLSPLYDAPSATPDFHREGWTIYCSDEPAVALPPRAAMLIYRFTHDFVLPMCVFVLPAMLSSLVP